MSSSQTALSYLISNPYARGLIQNEVTLQFILRTWAAMTPSNASVFATLAQSYLAPWAASGGVFERTVDEAHVAWADYRDPNWGGFVPPGVCRHIAQERAECNNKKMSH